MWFKRKKKQVEEQTVHANSHAPEQKASAQPNQRPRDIRVDLGIDGAASAKPIAAPEPESIAAYHSDIQLHDLKVKARRRLIGAFVVLGSAFLILPWAFDEQRKQTAPKVGVSIPDKNTSFDVYNPRIISSVEAEIPEAAKKERYIVVVAQLNSEAEAKQMLKRLDALNITAVFDKTTKNQTTTYQVRSGALPSKTAAQTWFDSVKTIAPKAQIVEMK